MTPADLRRAVATRIRDTGLLGCGCCQYGDRREDSEGTGDSIAGDVLDLLAELGLVAAPAVVDPVAAALAIHRPCHDESVPRVSGDCAIHPGGGLHIGSLFCAACTDRGLLVSYPCPTALALGVEPTERTARP